MPRGMTCPKFMLVVASYNKFGNSFFFFCRSNRVPWAQEHKFRVVTRLRHSFQNLPFQLAGTISSLHKTIVNLINKIPSNFKSSKYILNEWGEFSTFLWIFTPCKMSTENASDEAGAKIDCRRYGGGKRTSPYLPKGFRTDVSTGPSLILLSTQLCLFTFFPPFSFEGPVRHKWSWLVWLLQQKKQFDAI